METRPVSYTHLDVYKRQVLRRTEIPNDTSKRLTFDKLVIDLDSYELIVDGKKVDTPPKELELLYHLASTPNRVYTRNQLLDEVWAVSYTHLDVVAAVGVGGVSGLGLAAQQVGSPNGGLSQGLAGGVQDVPLTLNVGLVCHKSGHGVSSD